MIILLLCTMVAQGNKTVGCSTTFILHRKMSTANNHSSFVGIVLQLEAVVLDFVN
jgi:hypothetical protein